MWPLASNFISVDDAALVLPWLTLVLTLSLFNSLPLVRPVCPWVFATFVTTLIVFSTTLGVIVMFSVPRGFPAW